MNEGELWVQVIADVRLEEGQSADGQTMYKVLKIETDYDVGEVINQVDLDVWEN